MRTLPQCPKHSISVSPQVRHMDPSEAPRRGSFTVPRSSSFFNWLMTTSVALISLCEYRLYDTRATTDMILRVRINSIFIFEIRSVVVFWSKYFFRDVLPPSRGAADRARAGRAR
ncbi:PP88 [Orf virus]|uniref:PP88 n=1 Tax=Orf virus TaxID=10258 RepID=F1AX41_ORFV|nr:PP88 [Orf virus]